MPAPEVGDLDKPKFVFFFDEAHLLFAESPKVLLDKIEQVVRLVRSKGVGIYFITQNPLDIPDSVLRQLGNRVQHSLRAYTPREQKAVKAAAETYRANPKVDVAQAIIELGKQQEAAAARERDREREKERARAEREAGRRYEDRHERHYDYHGDRRRGRPRSTMVEKLARQAVSTAGRELVRGILGSLLR